MTDTMKRLRKNAARCDECGATIQSRHRHDFQSCPCGNLFVDGGLDYVRRGYMPGRRWTELSEWETVSETFDLGIRSATTTAS